MTQPTIRIKVRRRSVVRGKALVRFPASVTAQSPILLDRTGGNFEFSLDMNAVAQSLALVFQPYEGNADQVVTAGATVAVAQNAKTVRVNKTAGSATTLTIPDSNLKTCDVLISDWKGDAGTNNITINLSGTDKFPGGLSSWKIAADGGSIFLRRIPGVGYTI